MKILCSVPNRPCPPVNLHAHLQEGWHRWHQGKMHGLNLAVFESLLGIFHIWSCGVNLAFLGYRNGPERNASQVLSWQNRTCVQCNPACCWYHCQQAGQVSGIFWFFILFKIAINFLTWHPFASLALKPLVGGVWPHLHFATRAVYVMSGHSCGGKHFTLERPSRTLVCSGSVMRKQHCEY